MFSFVFPVVAEVSAFELDLSPSSVLFLLTLSPFFGFYGFVQTRLLPCDRDLFLRLLWLSRHLFDVRKR